MEFQSLQNRLKMLQFLRWTVFRRKLYLWLARVVSWQGHLR